jgi:hypothetical protein
VPSTLPSQSRDHADAPFFRTKSVPGVTA